MIRIPHIMAKRFRRFLAAEPGAALVEFAVLLPLTLVVFALIVEGGRIFWSYQNVITGVRDTARHLSRVAPSDLCAAVPSESINSYAAFATAKLEALSTDKIDVGLDQLQRECVAGDYRVSPAPVAVVTAKLTITELPFAPLFQLVGASSATRIETTVTDRSRVFGP